MGAHSLAQQLPKVAVRFGKNSQRRPPEKPDAICAEEARKAGTTYRDDCNGLPRSPGSGLSEDSLRPQSRNGCKCGADRELLARRASEVRKPACPAPAEIGAIDRLERDRDRRLNSNATFSFKRMVIGGHVHEERRCVNQTVNPIENAAMARNSRRHVFGTDVTLDHANRKITELSGDADNQTCKN